MIEIITVKEYDEQRQESLKQGEVIYNPNDFGYYEKISDKFSQECNRGIELRPGLFLEMFDSKCHKSINLKHQHEDFCEIISKFYLLGNHGVISPGIPGVEDNYTEKVGQNYLFYLPDIEEIEQSFAGEHINLIKISLDLDLFKNFFQELDALPKQLQLLIESNSPPRFHRSVGNITPSMHLALQQILNAPYQGALQHMYFEAKVLELLTLQFAQIVENEDNQKYLINLKAADVERIYQARDILIGNYDNPPSLLDLARMVGVNDNKLKYGFRQVFGNTVFGYLQNHRLEVARKLLQDNKLSVRSVLNVVGYANQSHFAAAFKRKYGITPLDCRLGKKPVI